MLVYLNGTNAQVSEAPGLDPAWFAHDASGKHVTNVPTGNSVMNPRNPGWRSYVIAKCQDFISRMGADGCYLDDMGAGNLTTNFSAVPVDTSTGLPYTDAGWIDATSKLAGAVKAAIPDRPVFANALNSGARYFGSAASWRILAAIDGGDAEGFVRSGSQSATVFKRESAWKQDVDMLVDAGVRGKAVLATTKLWVSASSSVINRWNRYAFATFLLGTDGHSYFNFNARGPGKAESHARSSSSTSVTPTGRTPRSAGSTRVRMVEGLGLREPHHFVGDGRPRWRLHRSRR